MNLVRTVESNFAGQLEKHQDQDLMTLVLEASEQEFRHHAVSTFRPMNCVSTERTVAVVTSDLRDFIAFELSLVEQVAFVYTAFRNNEVFYSWIVIDEFEHAVRERIYERQRLIIEEFPNFQFDFYILALMGRNVADLIGDPSMHLTYTRDTAVS